MRDEVSGCQCGMVVLTRVRGMETTTSNMLVSIRTFSSYLELKNEFDLLNLYMITIRALI